MLYCMLVMNGVAVVVWLFLGSIWLDLVWFGLVWFCWDGLACLLLFVLLLLFCCPPALIYVALC
jgi:hypothetical protein